MNTTPTVTDAHRALASRIAGMFCEGGDTDDAVAKKLAEHDAALTARAEAAEALVKEKDRGLELAANEFDLMVEGLLLTKIFEGDESLPHGGDISKHYLTKIRDSIRAALALTPTNTASVIAELRDELAKVKAEYAEAKHLYMEADKRAEEAAIEACDIEEKLRQELGQAVEEKVNVVMKKDAEIARLTEQVKCHVARGITIQHILNNQEIVTSTPEEGVRELARRHQHGVGVVERFDALRKNAERQRDALIREGTELLKCANAAKYVASKMPDQESTDVIELRIENWLAAVSGASSSAETLHKDTLRLDFVRRKYANAIHYCCRIDGDDWNNDFYGTLDQAIERDAARQPKEQP